MPLFGACRTRSVQSWKRSLVSPERPGCLQLPRGQGVGEGHEAPFLPGMGPEESVGRVQGQRILLSTTGLSPLSPLPSRHSEAQGPQIARNSKIRVTLRELPRRPRALLVPAEGSCVPCRGLVREGEGTPSTPCRWRSDVAGGGGDGGGGRGAGREVVPGARPRMLAAPAAAAAFGAARGLGRSHQAPLGPFPGGGDARSGRGLGRAVPACAA